MKITNMTAAKNPIVIMPTSRKSRVIQSISICVPFMQEVEKGTPTCHSQRAVCWRLALRCRTTTVRAGHDVANRLNHLADGLTGAVVTSRNDGRRMIGRTAVDNALLWHNLRLDARIAGPTRATKQPAGLRFRGKQRQRQRGQKELLHTNSISASGDVFCYLG